MINVDLNRDCYLYQSIHIATGRSYVGISVNPQYRWRKHIEQSRRGVRCPKFHRALAKYGPEAFEWKILAKTSVEGAKILEKWAIALGMGHFNLTKGGDGTWGYKPTPETLARMRKAQVGKTMSEAAKRQISASLKGHTHSAETREKIRATLTGRKVAPEVVEKLKTAQKLRRANEPEGMSSDRMRRAWNTRRANTEGMEAYRNKASKSLKAAAQRRTPEQIVDQRRKAQETIRRQREKEEAGG